MREVTVEITPEGEVIISGKGFDKDLAFLRQVKGIATSLGEFKDEKLCPSLKNSIAEQNKLQQKQ